MAIKRNLQKAAKLVGGMTALGGVVGTTPQAIRSWILLGRMPDSEYSCRTSYSVKIQEATKGKVTVNQLLGHIPTCAIKTVKELTE